MEEKIRWGKIKRGANMKRILIFTLMVVSITASCANNSPVDDHNQDYCTMDESTLIGNCEGCEAIFEYGDRTITSELTLPDFNDEGLKIKVTGTVYKPDGTTPAENVILYVYHTNQNGIYENKNNATNWERRHGYIRGWVKTDVNGNYTFYTLKPGIYPSRSSPAHIHITVLEPDCKFYWLGSYHFAGDQLLTDDEINPVSPRGGSSGLLNLIREGDLWVGTRDIILGKNVPGYE